MILKDKITNYILNNSNKIKINSKDIKKNDIFLALKGKKYHGNKFIGDAFKFGAKYCITDKKYLLYKKKNILFVENIYSILKNISVQKRSLFKGEVIGITGSAGKTSLKEYLSFFLKKKYKVSASIKSYNNKLGVMISILNTDINSNFAIFELGTNNFNEIRDLTKLVKPSQIFITNILSTHLENFKNKKNIAIEKSDIFKKKFNPDAKILFFQMNSAEEKIINKIAKKEKLKTIIKTGGFGLDCFISAIKYYNSKHHIGLKILSKNFLFILEKYENYQINNLIFVLAFFITNKINTSSIFQKKIKFPKIDGRGAIYKSEINNINIQFIDQSYNANPETMIESIRNFSKIKNKGYQKILILGEMNELGVEALKFHNLIIKETTYHFFDDVILSGDLFKKALKMFPNFENKFIYKSSSKDIMAYLNKNLHKKAMIMSKCSNSTEVNKFATLLKSKKKDKIV
jgi:UDP-N-acetylmuramoyl-tripeptide--D-alanyl-D-alanine ligase